MKTVLSNDMVAHVWAQQTQSEGRSNNGNFHFKDNVIYSYRTPIAVIHDPNLNIVLMDNHSYSATTSGKHKPAIVRALGYGRLIRFISVPNIGPMLNEKDHEFNIDYLRGQYIADTYRLKRAHYINNMGMLERIAADIKLYSDAFGLNVVPPNWQIDGELIRQFREEREARLNTPKAIEKRKKEKAKREQRKAEKEAQEVQARFEKQETMRLAWLSGDDSTYHYYRGLDQNGGALLRVKDDELQTSQGANVPLAHAIRAFNFIKLIKETGNSWARNGHTVRVGHFQIDSIDQEGNIRAGCHLINWPEIERIAKELNIFSNKGDDSALQSSKDVA